MFYLTNTDPRAEAAKQVLKFDVNNAYWRWLCQVESLLQWKQKEDSPDERIYIFVVRRSIY